MSIYLKVWHIPKYYPECRGRSIPPTEGHHLSHQNLSSLQSVLILMIWERLISPADLSSPAQQSAGTLRRPLSGTPLPGERARFPPRIPQSCWRSPGLNWTDPFSVVKMRGDEHPNPTLNLHRRKKCLKNLVKKGWVFSSVRRVKIKWHFPDIKIILLASFKCCSPEMFQGREERLGKKITFGKWWSDFPQPRGSPVQVWLHYVGLIIEVFICRGVILIRTRGNKKSSGWKWAALCRPKGFHYLRRIDRCGGFNVGNQVVKG